MFSFSARLLHQRHAAIEISDRHNNLAQFYYKMFSKREMDDIVVEE